MPERKRFRNILFSFTPLALMISAACSPEFDTHIQNQLKEICGSGVNKAIYAESFKLGNQATVGCNPFASYNVFEVIGQGSLRVENPHSPPEIIKKGKKFRVTNKNPGYFKTGDDKILIEAYTKDHGESGADIIFTSECPNK